MEARKESTWYCLLPQYRSEVCVFWPGQLYWLRCSKGSQCTHGNFSSERFLASLGQESLQNWAFGKNKNSIIYNIIYLYVYVTLHCVIIPKAGEQSPTPYIHSGYYLRANSHQEDHWEHEAEPGHLSREITASHCIPAAGGTLLAQRAHCFGSSSEVPWHTSLVPPAPLPEQPHTRKPSHSVQPTAPLAQRVTPAAHRAQGPLSDAGINSPCPQSSGFAWELQSLLSTRQVSEQFWFQPEEGPITYTNTPFAPWISLCFGLYNCHMWHWDWALFCRLHICTTLLLCW